MLPRVSIIIPVYNVEPYIEECLQSVMRQSYRGEIECILVDDCGTDNSMEVAGQLIEAYKGPVDFKVVRHEYHLGVSAARNTGIDASNYEYVFFLDSDDWISDDCIEILTQPFGLEQYDFVAGHYEKDGKDLYASRPVGEFYRKGVKSKGYGETNVAVWNKLFRKKFLLDNHLLFDVGKVYEDSIFSFDLGCIERKYYIIKTITYYYRSRENSITTRKSQDRLVDYVGFFQSLRDRVKLEKYKNLDGIYDYYLAWVKRIFRWFSIIEMDETMLNYVQKETQGFLDVIPNIRYLSNKHDRLVCFFCRKDQTYSRFQYVMKQYTDKYANRLSGRIMRNLLGLIPTKKVKCS